MIEYILFLTTQGGVGVLPHLFIVYFFLKKSKNLPLSKIAAKNPAAIQIGTNKNPFTQIDNTIIRIIQTIIPIIFLPFH